MSLSKIIEEAFNKEVKENSKYGALGGAGVIGGLGLLSGVTMGVSHGIDSTFDDLDQGNYGSAAYDSLINTPIVYPIEGGLSGAGYGAITGGIAGAGLGAGYGYIKSKFSNDAK